MKCEFENNKGYLETKELLVKGYNYKKIKSLVEEGIIEKIKRGIYKYSDTEENESEYIEISKVIRNAVFCLTSALELHELTTYSPYEYQVAIKRGRKMIVPEYPPIKIYKFDEKYYELGVEIIEKDGVNLQVYNMEKTICDCIRYRNKIGQDIVSEAIKEYIRKPNKNFPLLMEYAKECRVARILEKYMEVLV
ncbi:MAG: type IV toxin-antitoxin system AbiEi family antitoxin domain-containing protein [Sarcina sp.]